MAQSPIELYLVSGFLGAGKTTFMRALIDTFKGRRLGVLVNEFGSIGIDGTLVRQGEIKLVEINDGSIFCACLKDGFVRTLKAFARQPIDLLLIESSGMADPAGMARILEGLAPYLERPYRYAGNVCLVDCTTFVDYVDVLMPVQNQVASADLIVVNKTDLVNEAQLAEVHKFVRLLNEDAPVVNTIFAQVPPQALENIQSRGYSGEGTNTPASRPGTYTLLSGAPLAEAQAERLCAGLAGKILRFKGFLRRAGGGFWHLEGVAGQHRVQPADFGGGEPPPTGRLVLITFGAGDAAPEIEAAWAAAGAGAMELRAT